MIGLIDYAGGGNARSVECALSRLGAPFIRSQKIKELEQCRALILPGVGHAEVSLADLRRSKLAAFIAQTPLPLLGICVGMQILFEHLEEGDVAGLGIMKGAVRRFSLGTKTDKATPPLRIPHMGWNTVHSPDIPAIDGQQLYFVHSFFAPATGTEVVATCQYGHQTFAAAVRRGNILGVQFHPEKSGTVGAALLRSFVENA